MHSCTPAAAAPRRSLRQTAGGFRRACKPLAAHARDFSGKGNTVPAQHLLDPGAALRRYVAEQQILVRGHAHAEVEGFHDLAYRRAHPDRIGVAQPADFDRKPEVVPIAAARFGMPTVVVADLGNRLRLGIHEPDAEALAPRGL